MDARFSRLLTDAEPVAREIGKRIGVTRVAMIGELDEARVPVAQAFRNSQWSSTVGSGKSDNPAGARIGALMEEAEKFAQEHFSPGNDSFVSTYEAVREDVAFIDPQRLGLPFDSTYSPRAPIRWMPCFDIMQDRVVFAPSAVFVSTREPDDILFSKRAARKVFSTNGLASGFTHEEALVHAVSEVIERHAERLAELEMFNPGGLGGAEQELIDTRTLPAPTLQLVKRLASAGLTARFLDITGDLGVAAFRARVYREDEVSSGSGLIHDGFAAHPNADVSVHSALLEAMQSRVGLIAGAREDYSFRARSLGRHERPRPSTAAELFWYKSPRIGRSFMSTPSFQSFDSKADLEYLLDRLANAGFEHVIFVDVTAPEIEPARAVRVVIPDTEGTNPFHIGPHGRLRAIRDLL